MDAGTILLPTSKTKRGRLAFLDADARRRLGRYLRYGAAYPHADDPHLWVGRKGQLSADGMRQVLEKRGRLAGVRVPLHAFRRGFAHRWLRSGGSVPGLMAAAGWQDHAMPARYVRSVAADLAREEHARIFTEPAPRKRIIPPRR